MLFRTGAQVSPRKGSQTTLQFLLTRGPYAMLGYTWCGCTNGQQMRPRAAEWDEDFGEPTGGDTAACKETAAGSGIYAREWSEATVEWNCNTMHGSITRK